MEDFRIAWWFLVDVLTVIPGSRLHCRGRFLSAEPYSRRPDVDQWAHPNQVVTIHDLGPLEAPECYSRGFALWYSQLVPALARRTRKILTVSEYCRRRIVESLRVPENKVIVAGEAASSVFLRRSGIEVQRVKERFGIHSPYFLAVGAISPRKNLARLVTAWSQVTDDVAGSESGHRRQRAAAFRGVFDAGQAAPRRAALDLRQRRRIGLSLQRCAGIVVSVALRGIRSANPRSDGQRMSSAHFHLYCHA